MAPSRDNSHRIHRTSTAIEKGPKGIGQNVLLFIILASISIGVIIAATEGRGGAGSSQKTLSRAVTSYSSRQVVRSTPHSFHIPIPRRARYYHRDDISIGVSMLRRPAIRRMISRPLIIPSFATLGDGEDSGVTRTTTKLNGKDDDDVNDDTRGAIDPPSFMNIKQTVAPDLKEGEYKIVEGDGTKSTLFFKSAGRVIEMETGVIGKLAGGALTIKDGDTVLYTTACAQRAAPGEEGKPSDFTPLRVDYFERSSAAGRTNQGFFKRDGRPSDREILISRAIDRSIRPLLLGWAQETQTLSWVLSYDKQHLPSTLAVTSASAALALSEVPMRKPVACVRVAIVNDQIVINPTRVQVEAAALELVVSATKDAVVMVEGEANFLSEDIVVNAIEEAHKHIIPICDAIEAFAAHIGKEKKSLYNLPESAMDAVADVGTQLIDEALHISEKQVRGAAFDKAKTTILESLLSSQAAVAAEQDADTTNNSAVEKEEEENISSSSYDEEDLKIAIKRLTIKRLRHMVENEGKRIDGRGIFQVRDIGIETPVLPCTHGSALFTRGTTQALATITLGDSSMQLIDPTLHGDISQRFYLQYNFPPCSVGEVGRVGAPGRREVGHGDLAERALDPSMPEHSQFPYTVRAESLVTQSDGSSSMATVCACSLAMMDAGIPVKSPVAGVAMGLLVDPTTVASGESLILSDILGFEDALGMMDFKVAGNATGITSLQLDIKNFGLSIEAIRKTLLQARSARTHILDKMTEALPTTRESLAASAPKIVSLMIPPNAIGKLIGPGGKQIKSIIETYKLESCDVSDDGSVKIMAVDMNAAKEAKKKIESLVSEDDKGPYTKEAYSGPMPKVGEVLKGVKIQWIEAYGVFVEVKPGLRALCHISELDSKRVEKINDMFKVGDQIDVKVIDINEKNQLKLSRRVLLSSPSATSTNEATSKPKRGRPPAHRTAPKQ